MRQQEAERLAVEAERRVMQFGRWMWFLILPVLFVVLCVLYSANYHPAKHTAPPVFNCQSENASLVNIDAGGQIAPLCGNTPYPATPAGDGG